MTVQVLCDTHLYMNLIEVLTISKLNKFTVYVSTIGIFERTELDRIKSVIEY